MAKGRIIRRHIGESRKVDRLWEDHGPAAALLYTWSIPWLDIGGNIRADALWWFATVVPQAAERDRIELKEVRVYLEAMVDVGLFVRYEHDGRAYLHSPGFEDEQLYLRRDREDPECPPFPGRRKSHAGQQVMQRGQERPRRTSAKKDRGPEPPPSVEVDMDAEIPLDHILDGLGRELPQEWWEGHPSKRQVIAWWLEALGLNRHPRPPAPSIQRMGRVAGRLGEAHTRSDLARALVGMTQIFPYAATDVEAKSPHRSWDLMDLEKRFTVAHAAAMPDGAGDDLDREF